MQTVDKTTERIGNLFEWQDKAGGYAIQGRFAKFIKKIDGDYYNVVGLPVSRIYQELKNLGIMLDHENFQ